MWLWWEFCDISRKSPLLFQADYSSESVNGWSPISNGNWVRRTRHNYFDLGIWTRDPKHEEESLTLHLTTPYLTYLTLINGESFANNSTPKMYGIKNLTLTVRCKQIRMPSAQHIPRSNQLSHWLILNGKE